MTTVDDARRQFMFPDGNTTVTVESRQPAVRLDPDRYVVAWSSRLGLRFGLAAFGWLAHVKLGTMPYEWAQWLEVAAVSAALGFGASVAGMLYARLMFDVQNVMVERISGRPVPEPDDVREVARPGREGLRIVNEQIGRYTLTPIERAALCRLDSPNRAGVTAAIEAVTNDNYNAFAAAMVTRCLWQQVGRGYEWTDAGQEWRGK